MSMAAIVLLWPTSGYCEVKLVPGRVAPLDIVGEPAGFDSKSAQVFIHKPKSQKASPVLLYIHGGGGFTPGEQKVPELFRSFGFATVAFDAFRLNKIGGLSSQELSTKLSLTGKQQMLTPVAGQALDWILKQDWADQDRIYIYGHSNGARVALAMAGQVKPNNVRMIFADAPAHCCVTLPGALNVPVKLLFGDKDNYGGTGPNDLLYERRNPMTGDSIKQWSQKQLASGKLEIKFYDGGHGQFLGKGIPAVRVRDTQWRLGGDAERWKADITAWIAN
jgi:dienelactone hydrolase